MYTAAMTNAYTPNRSFTKDREIGGVNLRREAQEMHRGQRQDSKPESTHRRARANTKPLQMRIAPCAAHAVVSHTPVSPSGTATVRKMSAMGSVIIATCGGAPGRV